MSTSTIHTCSKTDQKDIDCTACQLAQLCQKNHAATSSDDDYSISTELTSKGNDYSILYLVIAAFGVLACVLLFYKFVL